MSRTNAWVTEDGFVDWAEERFGSSLVKRAQKRTVIPTPNPLDWLVAGQASLGDAYAEYTVTRVHQKYACSCQGHLYGEHRGVCSHILAVILWQKAQGATPPSPMGRPVPLALAIPEPEPEPAFGIPSPQSPQFGTPPLPAWVKQFRSHQWDAIQEVLAAFDSGKPVVIVDAPTGSGKTLLAETVRRLSNRKTLYTTTTKGLQTQIVDDFPYAKLLQGRANYATADRPQDFHPDQYYDHLSAAECTKVRADLPACKRCDPQDEREDAWHCRWCHPIAACPYESAKQAAIAADLAVVNLAFFLTEANGPGRFSGWPLVVLDEADTLESALMDYYGVTISSKWLTRLQLEPPPRKTVAATWGPWIVDQALPAVVQEIAKLPPTYPKTIRERRHLEGLRDRLKLVADAVGEGWVYTDYERGSVTFKPIRVNQIAPDILWQHGQRFLIMSATVISASQFAEDLGLESSQWASVQVANTFPAPRRPVYITPKGDLSYRTKAEGIPKVVAGVQQLARRYPRDRILIHTVSYDLTAAIARSLPADRVLQLTQASQRAALLTQFRQQPGAILLAPGLERGVDLPDAAARVVIIAKIPFPSLSDKQVAARLHTKGGDGWYKVQTVRSLVQMAGRGMRHASDSCHIYILDSQFIQRVWKEARTLLPGWFKEALKWSDPGDGVLRLWETEGRE